ncbi:MAG: polyprenyl synthetase family protein [Chloroflexi bacterium]|nr:polyprenyl synthetase family protein [Chloroflexota bacterium]
MNTGGPLDSLAGRYGGALQAEMEKAVGPRSSGLYEMVRYHLGLPLAGAGGPGGQGKALRPFLCLLAAEACGGNWRQAVPAAAAVELTHNFSLVHDDIQDASTQRRHRPTVWLRWGAAQAITAGDALWALAYQCLHRLVEAGVPVESVLAAYRLLDEACLLLCEGQYLDIRFQEEPSVSEKDYMDMIGKKTAALMSASLRLGAMVARAQPGLADSLGEFGYRLGLAFQIRDDVLGIWGVDEATGKMGEDLAQGKKTLPVVYALGTRAAPALEPTFQPGGPSADQVAQAQQALDEVGALEYAQRAAHRYLDEALDILRPLPLVQSAKDDLAQVAAFLVERDY